MIQNDAIALIDFQGMVVGPIAYDLASLFKDCYIEWPRAQQIHWIGQYYDLCNRHKGYDFSLEQLVRWFDFTALQRHLKVLGIFCRLHYRDAKPDYLRDLPLVEKYVKETLNRYPELAQFNDLL
jgi:aminoglycoside/choline kinase family phosphotransferase